MNVLLPFSSWRGALLLSSCCKYISFYGHTSDVLVYLTLYFLNLKKKHLQASVQMKDIFYWQTTTIKLI